MANTAASFDARFDEARLARAAGDFDTAIPALRELVRAAPGNVAVREELGYALLLAGRYGAAQIQFQRLRDETDDPSLRALYGRVLQRINADRPFGFGLILGVQPSTNINAGSSFEAFDTLLGTLDIVEDNRAQTGRKFTYGLTGFYRFSLSSRDQLRIDWRVERNDFSTDVVADETETDIQLSWVRSGSTFRTSLSAGFGVNRSDIDRRNRRILSATHAFLGGNGLRYDFAFTYGSNAHSQRIGRSGHDLSAVGRVTWTLPRDWQVWTGLQFERSRPATEFQRFDGAFLQFGGARGFANGTFLEATLFLGRRNFDGVFPLQTTARRDRVTELSVSASNSRIAWLGFSPRVTCRVRRNASNIGLFDSSAQECGFEIVHSF